MIRYALKCEHGHGFESWFKSAEAFDQLARAGHLSCVQCGNANVSKAIMAPRVSNARADAPAAPRKPEADKIAALRRDVEKNATYVGGNFAREARKMHLGDAPERSIYGEANLTEARALIDDGVPVLPLPFIPKSKAN